MTNELLIEALDLVGEAAELEPCQRNSFYARQCADRPHLLAWVQRLEAAPCDEHSPRLRDGLDAAIPELFPAAAEPDLLPGSMVGPYRVGEKIGSGGMGHVYRAVHTGYGGVVAFKVLQGSLASTDAGRERLQREAALLERCRHPGIVQIFFSGSMPDGATYFTMELVEGAPITEHCKQSALTLHERLRLFQAVCSAVQAAHAARVIHRDLKPSNILVRKDGAIKLLDFGIAEAFGDAVLHMRSYISIAYAAPEHADTVNEQADVYSLGVLLAELILGRLPFETEQKGHVELRRSIVEHGMPPLRTWMHVKGAAQPWLRKVRGLRLAEMESVCAKAAERTPEQRYATVKELHDEVSRFLARHPIAALQRPGAWWPAYRGVRFFTRHLAGTAITATFVALLLGLALSYTAGLKQARDIAVEQATQATRLQQMYEGLFLDGDAPLGNKLSAEALLDRGMHQAQVLDTEPDEQAMLFKTLGNAYDGMGLYARADQAMAEALAVRTRIHGAESLEAADIMIAEASLRDDEGQPQDGLALAQHALAIEGRQLSPNDPQRLRSQVELAQVYMSLGEYRKSVPLLQEAIRGEAGSPLLRSDLSNAINDLGIDENYLGNTKLSLSLDQQALAIDRSLHGNHHPDVGEELLTLANGHLLLGYFADAQKEAGESLAILSDWLPPGHHDIAAAENMLGLSLAHEGNLNQGLLYLQKALHTLQAEKQRSGTEALALYGMGYIDEQEHHSGEALEAYRHSLHEYQVLYPQPSRIWSSPLRGIAQVLFAEGKLKLAEEPAREAYELDRSHLGAKDQRAIRSKELLEQIRLAATATRRPRPSRHSRIGKIASSR